MPNAYRDFLVIQQITNKGWGGAGWRIIKVAKSAVEEGMGMNVSMYGQFVK